MLLDRILLLVKLSFFSCDLIFFLQDMEIWETVGLWHYTIPGFYLLAQFCLAILVAMGNLVNNSVFVSLTVGARQDENYFVEGKGNTFVFMSFQIVLLPHVWDDVCRR